MLANQGAFYEAFAIPPRAFFSCSGACAEYAKVKRPAL